MAASSSSETSTSRMCAPGSLPAWPVPLARLAAGPTGVPDFAVALADAAGAVLAVAEMGHVELRQRNADQIAALAADHLAVGDVLPQVLANLAAHDLLEARLVVVDFHGTMGHQRRVAANRSPVRRCTSQARDRPQRSHRPRRSLSSMTVFGISAGKDAGHVVQHVGGTFVVVAVIADQAALDHVDLGLRVGVDHVRDQARQLDRVLLVLEQLQLQGLVAAVRWSCSRTSGRRSTGRRCSS